MKHMKFCLREYQQPKEKFLNRTKISTKLKFRSRRILEQDYSQWETRLGMFVKIMSYQQKVFQTFKYFTKNVRCKKCLVLKQKTNNIWNKLVRIAIKNKTTYRRDPNLFLEKKGTWRIIKIAGRWD